MSAYVIEKDTVAFLLTPILESNGEWRGLLQSSMVMHPETELTKDMINSMFNLITMISAFMDVVQEDDYVYETVSDRRDEILDEHQEELEDTQEDAYEVVEGTEDKVIRLTRFTKTEGSA